MNGGSRRINCFEVGGATIALVARGYTGCQSEKGNDDEQLFQGVFFHYCMNFG